ncbi:MAG: chromosome condensation regulator RCC1, partial [Acidimicrobiaceae bacterium]
GFGAAAMTTTACAAPAGYVGNASDCNDTSPLIRPGGSEICDNVDNDCDGMTDEVGAAASCYPTVTNTTWSCAAGVCSVAGCTGGRLDCDLMAPNGCESTPTADPLNCGMCGRNCGAGGVCASSACDAPAELASGSHHTCIRRSSNRLVCWGNNGNGQLGTGDSTAHSTPYFISGLSPVTSVSASNDAGTGEHTCAVSGGNVYCTGANGLGQLGDSTFVSPRLNFGPIGSCLGSTCPYEIELGNRHTCALHSGGVSAFCWGNNSSGQLGNGTGPVNSSSPVAISGGLNVATLGAGTDHVCAVTDAGDLYCWGTNSGGALGTFGSSSGVPVRVCDAGTVMACAAGPFFTAV